MFRLVTMILFLSLSACAPRIGPDGRADVSWFDRQVGLPEATERTITGRAYVTPRATGGYVVTFTR